MNVEYEGFTNRNTFEVAHCIVNTQALAEVVKKGLHVCARRIQGWEPKEVSWPFYTLRDSSKEIQITSIAEEFVKTTVIDQLMEDCGGELEDFNPRHIDLQGLKQYLVDHYFIDSLQHAEKNRNY